MKKDAILINASRGTVVDIDALADRLKSGNLAGAAIDVFPTEPKGSDDEFVSPLRGFDNVILTPHIGGSTQEAQANIGLEVAEKLIKYSDNGTTTSSVNMPEVALPKHTDFPPPASCSPKHSRRARSNQPSFLRTRHQRQQSVSSNE